jgi:hypothetical protein
MEKNGYVDIQNAPLPARKVREGKAKVILDS